MEGATGATLRQFWVVYHELPRSRHATLGPCAGGLSGSCQPEDFNLSTREARRSCSMSKRWATAWEGDCTRALALVARCPSGGMKVKITARSGRASLEWSS